MNTAKMLGAALAFSLPAFPCRWGKSPASPHGFRDATADPAGIEALWRRHPGPLVGVPTGEVSRLDVLDIDAPRHTEAAEWWCAHRDRLPATRTHRTRSGGLHLLFRHAAGLRCSAGKIAPGIDVRANGGYVIWWPAVGEPVLCDAPPAPWPAWLLADLIPPPTAPPAWTLLPASCGSAYANAALRRAAERVARAPTGTRNTALNAEAFGLARLVTAGMLDGQGVAEALATAAIAAGLAPREIEATLRSAFGARGLL